MKKKEKKKAANTFADFNVSLGKQEDTFTVLFDPHCSVDNRTLFFFLYLFFLTD